jgi:hypothetical protein
MLITPEDRRGRCYELAAKYVSEHVDDENLRLCHGWPVLQGESEHAGKRYGHAWVERSKMLRLPFGEGVHFVEIAECWDTVSGDWLPKVMFYLSGKIEAHHVIKYSFADTLAMMLDAENYGPWRDSPYRDTIYTLEASDE